jgi:hypothetical protein
MDVYDMKILDIWEPIIYITKIVDVKKRREILGK